METNLGSDSPQTCSFPRFPLHQALFPKHRTQSGPKASCSPGKPLAGEQRSPSSSSSLPAKVSGLDADALHRLPSACTRLRVSEIKLKVSAMQTQIKVAFYSWGWYDGHQAGGRQRWSQAVLAGRRTPPCRDSRLKGGSVTSSSANSSSVIPGNLHMIKAFFKRGAKFWSQFYSTSPS